jgi:hypothetical protein
MRHGDFPIAMLVYQRVHDYPKGRNQITQNHPRRTSISKTTYGRRMGVISQTMLTKGNLDFFPHPMKNHESTKQNQTDPNSMQQPD